MFYGRARELNDMNEKFESDRKHFGVIYGRRQIGKTALANEFFKGKEGVYFQALRGTGLRNLKAFSAKVNILTGYPAGYVYPSWSLALDRLSSHFSGRRYCLVIDEYPYVAANDESFASVIQGFFDGAGDNLYLILIGSDVSFMKKQITDIGLPLYMRRTFEINLRKMPLDEALLFFDGLSADDRCGYLSLMSTYPCYLSAIDKNKTFEENVAALFFDRPSLFEDLPGLYLSDATRVRDVYNTILESVARGHNSIKEISADTGEERTSVSVYVMTLTNLGILVRKETFDGSRKTHYYVLDDPMLRFWYLFVYPNGDMICRDGRLAYDAMKDRIDDFLCRGFKEMAMLYVNKLNSEGKLGTLFGTFKVYKNDNPPNLSRPVELDAVARCGKTLLVAKCECGMNPFTNDMMLDLRNGASLIDDGCDRQYYIFSKSGFEDGFELSPDVHCFTAEDIVG